MWFRGKGFTYQHRRHRFESCIRGSPRGGNGNPHRYSWLENSHGQRTLMGHSSWGHKESNTTEKLSVRASKI